MEEQDPEESWTFIDDRCVFNYTETVVNLIPVGLLEPIKQELLKKGLYARVNPRKVKKEAVKNPQDPMIRFTDALMKNYGMDTKWIITMDSEACDKYGLRDVKNHLLTIEEPEITDLFPPEGKLPKFQPPKKKPRKIIEISNKAKQKKNFFMINLLPGTRSILAALRRINWSHSAGPFISLDRRVRFITKHSRHFEKRTPVKEVIVTELVESESEL